MEDKDKEVSRRVEYKNTKVKGKDKVSLEGPTTNWNDIQKENYKERKSSKRQGQF